MPRLNVFYVSGKALLLSDILSRSFQDVYLNQSFELSKKMAELIPPLQNLQIPSLTKLDSELLTDYILRNPPAETIDCWPKRYFYSQNVRKTMLHNSSQSIPSEQQLLLGLSLGWQNEAILSLPVWQSILASRGDLSKSLGDQVLKNHGLGKVHKRIQDLNLDGKVVGNIINKYHFVNKHKETSSRLATSSDQGHTFCNYSTNHKDFSYSTISSDQGKSFCNCEECTDIQLNIILDWQTFQALSQHISVISCFIKGSIPLLRHVCSEQITTFENKMVKLTCSNAKDVITFLFFQFLIKEISKNNFSFGTQNDRVSVTFLPFHINDDFEVKIGADNELEIYTRQSIEINKLDTESIKIKFLLGFNGKLGKFSLKVPDLIFLNSPVINENIIEIPYAVVFNCNENKIFIP